MAETGGLLGRRNGVEVVSLRERWVGGPCRGFSRTQVNYPQYIRDFDGPKSFLPTLVDYLSQARKDGKCPGEIFCESQKSRDTRCQREISRSLSQFVHRNNYAMLNSKQKFMAEKCLITNIIIV